MKTNTRGLRLSGALLEQLLRLGELPRRTQIRVPGSTPRIEAPLQEVRPQALHKKPTKTHPYSQTSLAVKLCISEIPN